MLEVLQILQMAKFVGLTIPTDELLEASHDKGMSDHLWDVVADFYEVAVMHDANLAELVADLGAPDEDTFDWDDIPF
jgi:hypothetical protein